MKKFTKFCLITALVLAVVGRCPVFIGPRYGGYLGRGGNGCREWN